MDTNSIDQGNPQKRSINPIAMGVVGLGILLLGGYALFANKGTGSKTQDLPAQIPQNTQKSIPEKPVEKSTQGNVKEFTMTAKKFEFSPSTITVSEGDKVRLTIKNLDEPHGFAINELGVKQDLAAGQTTVVEFIASKKGTFRFYCSIFCGQGHREMDGELIVNGFVE